jgi:serine protease Do
MRRATTILGVALLLGGGAALVPAVAAPQPDAAVLDAQRERADAIARASAATVCVFDAAGEGGGSGVLISDDGFALTNFHVVGSGGPAMKCGLNDGKIYDAVVVGIDPVGDVALIQLLGRDDFPTAEIGDSDLVQAGDWCFAAGNPFLLADDFTPSISYGLLSGVHRYQFPAGTLLEYTDCLQTDAAINPGNSGGPLFDAAGRLIGVNGRASFEKRGRVNVGVGYAISINQAMRFLSHLKSGRIVDHASLGAIVSTEGDGQVVVDDILETSDAYRRGLRYGDSVVRFAGRDIGTANALKNILGVFPRGWRVSLAYRRDGQSFETDVRLPGLHDESELVKLVQAEEAEPSRPDGKPEEEPDDGDEPAPGDMPAPDGEPKPARPRLLDALKGKLDLPAAVAKRYTERRGYANYWYNEQAQERLWTRYLDSTAVGGIGYDWRLAGTVEAGGPFALDLSLDDAEIRLPGGRFGVFFAGDLAEQISPPQSGGLLLAVHAWQRLVDKGLRRFGEVSYFGRLPHGPNDTVEDCLVALYEGMEVRFFFGDAAGDLTGIELFSADDADPCEIEFSQFAEVDGRRLPHRWWIRAGDAVFAELVVESWQTGGDNGADGAAASTLRILGPQESGD